MIGAVEPNWSGDRWLHASPLFTFAGIVLVYTPMKMGMEVIYQPRFDADRWLHVVVDKRPIFIFLVPSMAHLLIDHPRFADVDLSFVQMCSVGSVLGPLRPRAAAGEDARRDGVEQLRHDRGRVGLLHHAEGRSGEAPGGLSGRSWRRPSCTSSTSTIRSCRPMWSVRSGSKCPDPNASTHNDPEATAETWRVRVARDRRPRQAR